MLHLMLRKNPKFMDLKDIKIRCLLIFLILHYSKLKIWGGLTIDEVKSHWLWETAMDIFHSFLLIYRQNNWMQLRLKKIADAYIAAKKRNYGPSEAKRQAN